MGLTEEYSNAIARRRAGDNSRDSGLSGGRAGRNQEATHLLLEGPRVAGARRRGTLGSAGDDCFTMNAISGAGCWKLRGLRRRNEWKLKKIQNRAD